MFAHAIRYEPSSTSTQSAVSAKSLLSQRVVEQGREMERFLRPPGNQN